MEFHRSHLGQAIKSDKAGFRFPERAKLGHQPWDTMITKDGFFMTSCTTRTCGLHSTAD